MGQGRVVKVSTFGKNAGQFPLGADSQEINKLALFGAGLGCADDGMLELLHATFGVVRRKPLSESTAQPARPWRVIAHEITHEMDRRRVLELSEELDRALAQQGLRSSSAIQPNNRISPQR